MKRDRIPVYAIIGGVCALAALVLLFPFYGHVLRNWRDGSAVYQGVVRCTETGKPLAWVEVTGSFYIYDGFDPSLDGLYSVSKERIATKTDECGRFSLRLYGTMRRISCSNGYDSKWFADYRGTLRSNLRVRLKPPYVSPYGEVRVGPWPSDDQ